MTENNTVDPLIACSDCQFLKPVSRLRPFGENFSLICAECAFRDEDALKRTEHMVWHLAQEILAIFGEDEPRMGLIAIEIPVETFFGAEPDDNPAN